MLLGIDLMWETAENFENKLTINELSRTQYADNSESIMAKQTTQVQQSQAREEDKEAQKGTGTEAWGERQGEKGEGRKKGEEDIMGIQNLHAHTLCRVGTWLHKNKARVSLRQKDKALSP
jgi:hypothetical protein